MVVWCQMQREIYTFAQQFNQVIGVKILLSTGNLIFLFQQTSCCVYYWLGMTPKPYVNRIVWGASCNPIQSQELHVDDILVFDNSRALFLVLSTGMHMCNISFALVINSLRPSDAYMRCWTGSSLVQIMSCRLFSAKSLSEPMLDYC